MPVLDGQLAGHDGRARAMAVVEHLQQIAPVRDSRPAGADGRG
jgi:hypothetical protein